MFSWRARRDANYDEELLFVRRPPARSRSNRKKEEHVERRIHDRPVDDAPQDQWGRPPFPSYQETKRLIEIFAATGEGRGAFRAAESLAAAQNPTARPAARPPGNVEAEAYESLRPERVRPGTSDTPAAEPLATAARRTRAEKEYYVMRRQEEESRRTKTKQSRVHTSRYDAEVEEAVTEKYDGLSYADLPAGEDEVGLRRRRAQSSKIHEPPEVRFARESYRSSGATASGRPSTYMYVTREPTRDSRIEEAADRLRREEEEEERRRERERVMQIRKEEEKRRARGRAAAAEAERQETRQSRRRSARHSTRDEPRAAEEVEREETTQSRRRSGRHSGRDQGTFILVSRGGAASESEENALGSRDSGHGRLRGGAPTDSDDDDERGGLDSKGSEDSLVRSSTRTGRRMPPTKTSAIGGGIIPVPEDGIDTTPWEISLIFFCIIRGRVELSPKIETYNTYQELQSVFHPVRSQRTDRWLVKKLKQQYGIITRQSRGLLVSIFSMRRIGFAFFLQYQRTVRYSVDPGGFVLTARVPVISPDTEPTSQFRALLRHPPDYKLMLALLDRLVATRSHRQDFYMVEIRELPDAGKIFILLGLLILLCTGGGTSYAVIRGDVSTGIAIATYALTCFSLFLALVAAGDYIGLKKPNTIPNAYDVEDKRFGGNIYSVED